MREEAIAGIVLDESYKEPVFIFEENLLFASLGNESMFDIISDTVSTMLCAF